MLYKRKLGFSSRVAVPAALLLLPSLGMAEGQKLDLSVSAGLEFDDNVTVSTIDQTTGESDQALVFDLSANYMLIEHEGQELELSYDLYQSLYNDFSDFDLQIHTFSAWGSWELESFDPGLNYSYTRTYLGGDRLFESNTLTPSVSFEGRPSWYHRLSYGYLDKNFFTLSERDAEQQSISSDNYYFFSDNKAYVSLGIRLEDENTSGPEFDYQGGMFSLGTSMPIRLGTLSPHLKVNYQYYWRDYENVTASIGERRDDRQDSINFELDQPLSKDVSAKLNYEWVNADSNLPSADYQSNVLSLSLQANF